MIYYAPTIFAQLGLDGNTTSLLATGVYGIVNCLSTLPALFFIDKVGRRPLLMAGATGTCISLVIVGGILGGYGAGLVDNKSAGWAGIAFIYIYDINFSYSFGERESLLDSTTWLTYHVISPHRLGPSIRDLQSVDKIQSYLHYNLRDMDVQLVSSDLTLIWF